MITRKMRLSMAMLTIAASVLTTGNIKADEKDTTNETNTATESKYANKAVADIYSTTTLKPNTTIWVWNTETKPTIR